MWSHRAGKEMSRRTERPSPGTSTGGDRTVVGHRAPGGRLLILHGLVDPVSAEQRGRLTKGLHIEYDERSAVVVVHRRVHPALGVKNCLVEGAEAGAKVSAVVAGQIVGKLLGRLRPTEALDPRSAEELVDEARVQLQHLGDLLHAPRDESDPQLGQALRLRADHAVEPGVLQVEGGGEVEHRRLVRPFSLQQIVDGVLDRCRSERLDAPGLEGDVVTAAARVVAHFQR